MHLLVHAYFEHFDIYMLAHNHAANLRAKQLSEHQGSNYTEAIEAIACPFQGMASMPLDHCQPWGYSLPLVGLGSLLLLCPVALVSPKNKKF